MERDALARFFSSDFYEIENNLIDSNDDQLIRPGKKKKDQIPI